MAGRSSTVDVASAEASGYLLEVDLNVPPSPVTEAQDWTQLKPTGDIHKDLLSFYELEYKYSTIAGGRVRMSPRRREVILERMEKQAKALGAAIAEAALPTFDSWIRAHDLEHLDVMGAERMGKLQKRYRAKGKTSNINDWVLKQRTTGVSMSVVTPEEWMQAIAGDEAPALRFALELLHEEGYADKGDFDRFVRKVVARDPIGTMRKAIQQVDPGEQEAAVLQMFQTVYPIGYRKRLGETSAKVGRNIISADQVLKDVAAGKIDPPELFVKINWAVNVVHQAGTMASHVANDMGISVQYLDKLSNLDTSAWDEELRVMEPRRESKPDDLGSVAESASTYLLEAVGEGEWWIDGSGYVQFADGDIVDMNHAAMALQSIMSYADVDIDDPNIPEIAAMESLSDEAEEYLKERNVDPKVIEFLGVGGDPREWMIENHGWIRLIGSSAELWRWDQETLELLRDGVFEAWGLDVDKVGDEDYVLVEEAKTRDLFQVPLRALMDKRFDAAALRRLAKEGIPKQASAGEFMRSAWARKAAGERGVGEAVDDDPIDDRDFSFDWDMWYARQSDPTGKYVRRGRTGRAKPRPRRDFEAKWEIQRKLARTSRPGYSTRTTIPVERVDRWIAGARKAGIKSIIVLLGPDQMHMYKDVPGGLVNYYRKNGFKVAHVPTVDKHRIFIKAKTKVPKGTEWLSQAELDEIYAAYRRLPKPVLVHCSAGIDRSGAAVRYIKDREQGTTESAGLTMDSAAASSYLMEALGAFEYEVPDDKEQQLYDFYMMTFLPEPEALATSGTMMVGKKKVFRKERPDLAMAVDDTRKTLTPRMKRDMLNAAFYSIACEARYIIEKTANGDIDKIVSAVVGNAQIKPVLQNYNFGKDMGIRVRNYWKEYQHLLKYPVSAGKSFEAPGVVPEVLGKGHHQRNASYRAALIAFEGQIEEFIRFASWGFWDRPWGGFNKKRFVEAMKENDRNGMKSASGSYGGGNWGRIADAWVDLFGSKRLNDDIINVDRLYSLQHNTGAMLNKVQSYMKNNRYSWLDRALNKKFGAESPYEFAKGLSPSMRRLAMPVVKAWYGTTLEQWVKDNPTKDAADATKAGKPSGGYSDGAKKDYVRTKSYSTRPSMKKSLIKWFKDVTPENVDKIFAAAEKAYGFGEMKKWQFPVFNISKTKVKSSPPMVQGQTMSLVQVKNGVLGNTEKHQYFDKKKPGTSWMSAKHLGIKPELTHFRKETAAPPKPKAALPSKPAPWPTPKKAAKVKVPPGLKVPSPVTIAAMGFPTPEGPPVDVAGVQSSIQKQVAVPVDDVYMEVFQPPDKIRAIKAIRQTYQMGLKDAKKVVDSADAKNAAPSDMADVKDAYLKFWWPRGNFVTLGDDVTHHPQAEWGKAQVAYARFMAEAKWVFLRSDLPVKMIMVNGRWYVPATRVMDPSVVESWSVGAPKLGAQMAQVVKLAGGQKKEMAELLQQTFKAEPSDAAAAVDAIPTAKLPNIGWVNYSLGTTAFAPNKFVKQVPVSVAVWSVPAKAVVPVEMAAWRMGAHDIAYEFFVMNETVVAALKAVDEAPVEPVEVHEGKMMYTVHDHGVGNAKLFGPSGDANEVSTKAAELGKDYPNAGINEYVYLDGQWQLVRQYNRAWQVLNTNDPVMDVIKVKAGKKPAPPGAEPSPKPEDVGVYFMIRAEDPDSKVMKYAFGNKFISWSQVEKALDALYDPGSGIKGTPFKAAQVTIEKWAYPKAWPEGVEGKTKPVLVEMMKASPSKTKKGKYDAMITFTDEEWEKIEDPLTPGSVAVIGQYPEDRAQAAALAKGEPVKREPVDNPVVTFTVKAKSGKAVHPVKFLSVFANAFTHWDQVMQAKKAMKDPNSGIEGAPIAEDDIRVEKWAHPIAWAPGVDVSKYRLDTSKPIKVEQLNVDGSIKWTHPAWSKVVDGMKAQGKPWAFGFMPGTRAGALQWSKIAAAIQVGEPELTPEQALTTVEQALMLPGIEYDTSVQLNVHPDDASLDEVWGDLSLEAQSDIQVAIGEVSAEALKKKTADIFRVYPVTRDDVDYMVQVGSNPVTAKLKVTGKWPLDAMTEAHKASKRFKGKLVTIRRRVKEGVGDKHRTVHMFEANGELTASYKPLLDPSVSTNKFTGLRKAVPHHFVFIDADGNRTGLKATDFHEALNEANVIEHELPGDLFGNMYLAVDPNIFFKITGKTTHIDVVMPVKYGLPEGYVADVDGWWSRATGVEPTEEKKPEPAEKDVWTELDVAPVGEILETFELSDEAREDLFHNAQSGDTMADVWDSITDHTKTEVKSAWRKQWKKALPIKEKPWNAWTVQEVVQLPIQPEAKDELKEFGGGMVLGEVWEELSEPVRKDIMATILDWQAPEVEKPKKEPKIKKPGSGVTTTELSFGQVKMFLGVPHEAQDKLDVLQAAAKKSDSATIAYVWPDLSDDEMQDITLAYDDWKIEQQKVSQKKPKEKKPKEPKTYLISSAKLGNMAPVEVAAKLPTNAKTSTELTYGNASSFDDLYGAWNVLSDDAKKNILQAWDKTLEKKAPKKKVKKKKAPKKPTEAQAMKALQSWTIADAMEFLELPALVVKNIQKHSTEPKKQSVMSVWSLLSDYDQEDIIAAWIAHKHQKLTEPKKPKQKEKAPTYAEAEKNVKTWKTSSVYGFLDPSVHDGVKAAQAMTGKHAVTTTIVDVWDAMTVASRNNLVDAYIEFMKKKHGLESVSADASCYLLEDDAESFPKIVLRKDYGAAGGRDLYFIKWKADGRRYCYALGASIRADIERIESFSLAKAASIVKARSRGEYDCKTGEIKHVESKPKKARKRRRRKKVEPPPGPAQVQTTLFGESAEASVYLLGETVVVEAVYRADLLRILEDVDDPDEAGILVARTPPKGLSASDKKVRRELQSSEYPATAEDGKAFVFHWADGRGACAFKYKKDAIVWINDEVNCPNGPDIVGWWYDQPYCPKSKRDKKHRLRVASSYTRVKPKKGKKTEAARKRRDPATYMSVGHRTKNRQAWYMKRGSDNITYGELGSTHAKLGVDFGHADVFGRVDHDSKRVSVWDSGTGRSDYAISILRMDFPSYEVWLSRAGSDPVRVPENVEKTEATEPPKPLYTDRSKEMWRPPIERIKHTFPHGFIIDGEFRDIGTDVHVRWAARELGIEGSGLDGELKMGDDETPVRDEMARRGWVRLTNDSTIVGEGGVEFYGPVNRQSLEQLQNVLLDKEVKVRYVWVEAPNFPSIKVEMDDLMTAKSLGSLRRLKVESVTEDVDRDAEADRMLNRYREEPTSIWLYTDMPVKDRVAWAYLAADRFKGVEGEDLVERFIETLHQVVDDPETFWQQIREKSPVRANYLDHLDWDIETVDLKDVGVYPRFSGFSAEICQGSVIDTARAIETTDELPEKVAKLREMSDVWMTILKFLPPILVPGGILRSEERGYDVLKWTCDDGNHRLVSAAMAGAKEAVCFVGTQKKEKIEPAELVMAGGSSIGAAT